MPVGGFPNLKEFNRRAVRGPVNPLDKSTVISIYPRAIKFNNPTLQPGRWFMEAGSYEKPTLMTIGPSSWFKDVGPDEPLIEIVQSSIQIAESLVKDYTNGMFACNMVDAVPGLLFVPGEINHKKLRDEHQGLVDRADKLQKNYYRTLIKFADSLWARSNGNPLAIMDEMRIAAKALGLNDRDWMKEHANIGLVPCQFCGAFKNPDYPVCRECHSIDMSHPKAQFIQKLDPFHGIQEQPKGK